MPITEPLAKLLMEVDDVGPGASLTAKVRRAQSGIGISCGALAEFDHELNHMPQTVAQHLLTDSRGIEAVLGCRQAWPAGRADR